MRDYALDSYLKKADSDWSIVNNLIENDKIIEIDYKDHKYYLRKI
jgi:hypothetical protein